MALYIRLLRLTEAGVKSFKDQKHQLEGMRKLIEMAGGKLEHAWVTQGNYDIVSVISVPDEEAMKKMNLAIKQRGLYTGHTMQAIPVDEFVQLFGMGGHASAFIEQWFRASKKV
jgi:uncharacterized protein with GYD domain